MPDPQKINSTIFLSFSSLISVILHFNSVLTSLDEAKMISWRGTAQENVFSITQKDHTTKWRALYILLPLDKILSFISFALNSFHRIKGKKIFYHFWMTKGPAVSVLLGLDLHKSWHSSRCEMSRNEHTRTAALCSGILSQVKIRLISRK